MGALPANRSDDLALAQRAAGGERVAQRDLFQAQRLGVHHTLFRILGANREIEDLIQDAFLEIFRALPSFRGDSSLGRWCQTIATRTAYLAISKRKPQAIDLALVEDSLPSEVDGHRHVQMREVARRLYVALDKIDVRHRVAFTLAIIDGRPMAEVAELTDATTVGVRTRVWRARRELMRRAKQDPVLSAYLEELGGGA